MVERRNIIIDTDPGQDDAIAILLALASPALHVAGIVTVAGNVPLRLTTSNALKLVELAGRTDVPVIPGCERPMLRPLVTAEYVHGQTGMDGADLPDPKTAPLARHGVDWLVETVMAAPAGTYTLCALGPLTNVATALVREIVLMGGGFFEGGNTTPAAEFNIYVDPHAAAAVMASGIRITMMPLDITHKAIIRRPWLDRLAALGTPVARAAHGMLDFFERYDIERYGGDGGPLHDPCVIAWLLEPDLFQGRHCNVEIELAGTHTLGMTVVDWWGATGRPKNAHVMRDIDADGFFELIFRALASYRGT